MLAVLDDILKIKPKKTKKCPEGQFADSYNIIFPELDAPTLTEISNEEVELCSIYISSHPFSQYLPIIEHNISTGGANIRIEDFYTENIEDGTSVLVGAFVKECKMVQSKKGQMAILSLDDISESIEAVVFPNTYTKYAGLIEKGESFLFKGKLQYKENFYQKNNDSDEDADDVAEEIPQIIVYEIQPFPETIQGYIPYDLWVHGKKVEMI